MKLPALHFYPGDWKKDLGVQALEFFDRHVWFEMLLLMHDSEERGVLLVNGKPPSEEALARLIGLDKQTLSKALANIKDNGVCGMREDGAYFSRRMVRDEDIRQKRIKAGSSGGNPALLKQNPSKTEAAAQPRPEDVIEDESRSKKETVTPKKRFITSLDTPDCRDALDRWIDYQLKTHRKTLGEQQIHALQLSYSTRPADFVRDINYTISNGWKGIQIAPDKTPQSRFPDKQKPPEKHSTVPSVEKTKKMFQEMEAQATHKPLGELLTDEDKKKLASIRGDLFT
jgi:hypothetical protein